MFYRFIKNMSADLTSIAGKTLLPGHVMIHHWGSSTKEWSPPILQGINLLYQNRNVGTWVCIREESDVLHGIWKVLLIVTISQTLLFFLICNRNSNEHANTSKTAALILTPAMCVDITCPPNICGFPATAHRHAMEVAWCLKMTLYYVTLCPVTELQAVGNISCLVPWTFWNRCHNNLWMNLFLHGLCIMKSALWLSREFIKNKK